MKHFCFGASKAEHMASEAVDSCIFCPIARGSTSTALLYADEKVVAFPDINPSAFRHYLVIPVEHISTVNHLQRTSEDYQLGTRLFSIYYEYVAIFFLIYSSNDTTCLNCDFCFLPVNHMLRVGKDLLKRDAPDSVQYSWRQVKYAPLGPFRGFLEAEKLLNRIKPQSILNL